jgi:hypothetical protein
MLTRFFAAKTFGLTLGSEHTSVPYEYYALEGRMLPCGQCSQWVGDPHGLLDFSPISPSGSSDF